MTSWWWIWFAFTFWVSIQRASSFSALPIVSLLGRAVSCSPVTRCRGKRGFLGTQEQISDKYVSNLGSKNCWCIFKVLQQVIIWSQETKREISGKGVLVSRYHLKMEAAGGSIEGSDSWNNSHQVGLGWVPRLWYDERGVCMYQLQLACIHHKPTVQRAPGKPAEQARLMDTDVGHTLAKRWPCSSRPLWITWVLEQRQVQQGAASVVYIMIMGLVGNKTL